MLMFITKNLRIKEDRFLMPLKSGAVTCKSAGRR